jgi:hypothetical protein
MSNLAIFGGAAVPAFARNNELSDTAKALMGGAGGVSTKRISIKGGVFRLLAGGKEVASIEERHLDVIVVKAASKVSRVFYAGSYDKDAASSAPDCWSNDGERPDNTASNKQAVTCMACPQNVAGSGQGNSRACRYQQRLAVVLANNPEGDVLQLTLPATSVFGKEEGDKRPLQAFVRYLAVQNPPINPEQIVTRMKFDTKVESPKLVFAPVRWLTEDEYAVVKTQGESDEAKRAVVMNVAQADGVKAAPLKLEGRPPAAPAAEEEAPAPKAKAAPAEAEAEAEAEPEKRKAPSKTNAVPAAKGNLASIVSDWDDE